MAKLGDYVKIRTGKLDANAACEEGQYPFFTCAITPLKIDSFSYDCECALVAGNGDLNVKYFNGKFDAYQRTYIVESKDKTVLTVPYIFRFLEKYVEALRSQAIGGVIKYIKLGNLTEAIIDMKTIYEQERIVSVFDKIDNLLNNLKEQSRVLDDLIKSRFFEMFGNGEYLSVKLRDICMKITDGTHKTPTYLNDGIPFISAKNIKDGKIDFDDIKYISDEEYREIQKRCQISKGDLLLTKSGSLGMPALVDVEFPFGVFESLAVLKYDRKQFVGAFLHAQICTDDFQHRLLRGVKGIAIKHLHLNVIGDTEVIVPPIVLQNQFAAFVQQTEKSKAAVQQSIDTLQTLKASLMQEYFG